jgi:hypothetical protein
MGKLRHKKRKTGNLCRLRRSGDTSSIGFNGLNMKEIEAFANGRDVYVSKWYDQSNK